MKTSSGDKKELSSALEAHLSGKTTRQKTITLEGRLAGSKVEVSDNSGYFFVSKVLREHMKEKGPKYFLMTLKGWEFESPAGQQSKVDLRAKDVSLERLGREPSFVKSGQNIMNGSRIRSLLQVSSKSSRSESSKQAQPLKGATAAGRKAIEARSESAASEGDGPKGATVRISKKIQKPVSGETRRAKPETSIKLKRNDMKSDDGERAGKSGKMTSIEEFDMHGITPEELIETPDFVPNKRKASVTKSLKFSPMKKGSIAPQRGLQILSSKLRVEMSKMTSEVPRTSILAFREEVNPVLMKNRIEVKDILVGIQKALIAWDEVNFPTSSLELLQQNPHWLSDPDFLSKT